MYDGFKKDVYTCKEKLTKVRFMDDLNVNAKNNDDGIVYMNEEFNSNMYKAYYSWADKLNPQFMKQLYPDFAREEYCYLTYILCNS